MKFTLTLSDYRIPLLKNSWIFISLLIFTAVWINSLLGTTDIKNWFLENTLTFIFIILIIATFKKYQFSDLTYLFICFYLCLHVYGSKYTYAENPFGYWLQDQFATSRNHYDRIVHFSFGFLLAYPMRELFLKWLKLPKYLSWILPVEITLSVSAIYELIEWAVADVFFKAQGDAYLGTQGDIWDAQKDIFSALSGAVLSTLLALALTRVFQQYRKSRIEVID